MPEVQLCSKPSCLVECSSQSFRLTVKTVTENPAPWRGALCGDKIRSFGSQPGQFDDSFGIGYAPPLRCLASPRRGR
jgi:hypothetical protein